MIEFVCDLPAAHAVFQIFGKKCAHFAVAAAECASIGLAHVTWEITGPEEF
jgi:hypothetical protein